MNRTLIDDTSRMRYELARFLLDGAFELCEDLRPLTTVAAGCAAAELSYGKLILSCWGEGWARSWRVLRCELFPHLLRLECARQMGRLTCTLELRRGEIKSDTATSRSEFAARLAGI